jgi:hypothetical protein
MEVAQYGDTEISSTELKVTVDKLRQCDKDKGKCKLEDEFEVSWLIVPLIFLLIVGNFRIYLMHLRIGNLVLSRKVTRTERRIGQM